MTVRWDRVKKLDVGLLDILDRQLAEASEAYVARLWRWRLVVILRIRLNKKMKDRWLSWSSLSDAREEGYGRGA